MHSAADDVLARFAADPPAGLDAATLANIRLTIARHSQDADEMPDPDGAPCGDLFGTQDAVYETDADSLEVDEEG